LDQALPDSSPVDQSVPDLAGAADMGCANCGMPSFACCGGQCVDTLDDIMNCGKCGNVCSGQHPYCNQGTCGTPPCSGVNCVGNQFCCGTQCCQMGMLCCDVPGPVEIGAMCTAPVNGNCPAGCTACQCNPKGTLIAGPWGERAIETLVEGELVYSIDRGRLVVVPIRATHRESVHGHQMVLVVLESGATVRESPRHPTADGRTFDRLRAGDTLDGMRVVEAAVVPYVGDATYDLLPDSDSGAYFADGVLVGSTLARAAALVAEPPAPWSFAP
jgi:hypothetical protein